MNISDIIVLTLIIVLMVSVIISIRNNGKYFIIEHKYKELKRDRDKNYIKKNNIILRNAVYEALMQAKEKNNNFEQIAYERLLEQLKNNK